MSLLTPSIIKLQVASKAAAEFVPITGENNGQLTLSDHSRSPLSVNYEMIENSQRMANGTLRKYIISKKRSLSCSWELLPTINDLVVDGNASALSMKRFFEVNNVYPMNMTLYYKRNSSADFSYSETIEVFWDSFNFDVIKRYKDFDYWNITTDFMEI
jgi:hypothetical protein